MNLEQALAQAARDAVWAYVWKTPIQYVTLTLCWIVAIVIVLAMVGVILDKLPQPPASERDKRGDSP